MKNVENNQKSDENTENKQSNQGGADESKDVGGESNDDIVDEKIDTNKLGTEFYS